MIWSPVSTGGIRRLLAIVAMFTGLISAGVAQAQDCSCYGGAYTPSINGCYSSTTFRPYCPAVQQQTQNSDPIRMKLNLASIRNSITESAMSSPISVPNPGGDDTAFSLFMRNGIVPGGPSVGSGATHLGMYTAPVAPSPTSVSLYAVGGGGGSISHGSGFSITDTNGVLAPGSTTPSFHDEGGGGGVKGIIDLGSYFSLPNNQGLVLTTFFEYRHDSFGIGAVTGTPLSAIGPYGGSARLDAYRFGGYFTYNIDKIYLEGTGIGALGRGNETSALDGSTGSYNTSNGQGDLRLGKQFILFNTIGQGTPGLITKGAPSLPVSQGYSLGLDLSGHVGYTDTTLGSYVDSAGFAFGDSHQKFGDAGGRAKFFAVVPSNGLFWSPFIAGSIDQRFGFQSSSSIPVQAALPTGDNTYIHIAQTFYGGQLGLDVRNAANNWTVGIKGFVYASADQNSLGGSAYVKIPLWTPPARAPALVAKY